MIISKKNTIKLFQQLDKQWHFCNENKIYYCFDVFKNFIWDYKHETKLHELGEESYRKILNQKKLFKL